MRFVVRHETVLRYDPAVRHSIQYLRLTPRSEAGQRVLEWRIDAPGRQWHQADAYGNVVVVTSLSKRHDEVRIVAQGCVETFLIPETYLPHQSTLPPQAFLVPSALTQADDDIREMAAQCGPVDRDPPQVVQRMLRAISARLDTMPRSERTEVLRAPAVLARGRGTPEECTHVFLACARAAGLPARYVSGYTTVAPGRVDIHAWADVWIDQRGWLSVDPALATWAGASSCRLATGRDELDAGPVRDSHHGVLGRSFTGASITAETAPAGDPLQQ